MANPDSDYYYSGQQLGIDRKTKEFIVERCMPFITGPNVLDLGFVDDMWVSRYLEKNFLVDVVEGNPRHIARARAQFGENPSVEIFHSLFDQFVPDKMYNTIVAGDMLRYIGDDLSFIKKLRGWLVDGGSLVVTVPNNRSLHRRIGSLMGMEPHPDAMNRRDVEVENLRCYDRYSLRNLIIEGGFVIRELHGCFLKPLSSKQIENWSDELLAAFNLIGDELEDYCWFLYAVCLK